MDILKKSVGLGHFLEYLAEIKSKYLLDFWLEAETLHMVLETSYTRKSPTIRRRLSRTKSLSNSSKRDLTKTEENTVKTDLSKQNDINKSFGEIENKDKETLLVSNQDTANEKMTTLQGSNCESKNTFEEPLNRKPLTLRTYEEFKTRSKSRSIFLSFFSCLELVFRFQ